MKEIIIKVNGMHCEGCEKRIQNAVKDIEGVEEVAANHKDGIVVAKINSDTIKSVIEETIEDIGFEVERN